jgi:transcriptional repressor NrdR
VHCPYCRNTDSRVVDSRTSDDGSSIRRRRLCPSCGRRFSTVETTSLSVVKRSGVVEPFSRDKVVSGVRKACQGRPVTDDSLALLAQKVEETVRASGAAEIDAHDVGLAILGPLRELDEVAYLRFASVYQDFASLVDFESAIAALRHDHAARTRRTADDVPPPNPDAESDDAELGATSGADAAVGADDGDDDALTASGATTDRG